MEWLGVPIFSDRVQNLSGWRRSPLSFASEVVMIGKAEDGNDAHSRVIQILDGGCVISAENEAVIAKENVTKLWHGYDHTL